MVRCKYHVKVPGRNQVVPEFFKDSKEWIWTFCLFWGGNAGVLLDQRLESLWLLISANHRWCDWLLLSKYHLCTCWIWNMSDIKLSFFICAFNKHKFSSVLLVWYTLDQLLALSCLVFLCLCRFCNKINIFAIMYGWVMSQNGMPVFFVYIFWYL